jgi:adhesin transport system membrane fusion protein
LTEWEEKRNKTQESESKLISTENKLLVSKNELLNANIEINSMYSEYADKIAKAGSDRFSALSSIYDAEGSVSKLKNLQSNYESRQQYYYILAPQDGIVTKIYKKGLGETIKEEESLLTMMPLEAIMAVEMYIRPMDYPLLELEEEVVFFFDGWPAFVLSGWPEQSIGTFRGKVSAIDNLTSENNLFRVLVREDENSNKPWPKGLRVGAAADGTILLNDVQLWYEVWRQLNGFPPDYYNIDIEDVKLKAPLNQLKK